MLPPFFKASVRIKYLLCNILPLLICMWNEVQEICAKKILKKHLCALKFSRVRSSHDLGACVQCAHSLEGTLMYEAKSDEF